MDPTELALLAGVCAEPADDAARLVYADWLDENASSVPCPQSGYDPGEPHCQCARCHGVGTVSDNRRERAEVIRVQCRIAIIEQTCGCGVCVKRRGGGQHHNGPCAASRRQDDGVYLKRRDRDLVDVIANDHFPPFVSTWSNRRYRRGFLSSLTCSAADFFAHADELVWRPDQTSPCPECDGRGELRFCDAAGDMDDEPCRACGGKLAGGYHRGSGRVARPCPPTAQPIEEVTFIDWLRIQVSGDALTNLTYTVAGLPGEFHLRELIAALELEPPLRALRVYEIISGACAIRFKGIKFNVPEECPNDPVAYNEYRRLTGRSPVPAGGIDHRPIALAPEAMEVPKTGWIVVERRVDNRIDSLDISNFAQERFLLQLSMRGEPGSTPPTMGTWLTDIETEGGRLHFPWVIITGRELRATEHGYIVVLTTEAMMAFTQAE